MPTPASRPQSEEALLLSLLELFVLDESELSLDLDALELELEEDAEDEEDGLLDP